MNDEEKEAQHFRQVVMTFQKYKSTMLKQISQAEASYQKVKEKYGIRRDFELLKTLAIHNQTIIDEIIEGSPSFSIVHKTILKSLDVEEQFGYKIEKDKSIIKQHHVQFDRIKTTLKVRKKN